MPAQLSTSAQKVQKALTDLGLPCSVVELPQSTHTAKEAAQAVGCKLGQIAKSLIFRAAQSGKPVLVIISGDRRVDEKKVQEFLGEPIAKADADFVRQATGFVIGGVPPVGHDQPLTTFIGDDLMRFEQIWAAAGTPKAVFKLTPQDLIRMTQGQVVCVT
ncbi:MAG: YbaK/EbsC family protein [Desulfarculaceae bacterium]|jgi:prolyl-tRNA editing enzyme YbaK/EbsC (Cys-tRNA(Pro) deacylase)